MDEEAKKYDIIYILCSYLQQMLGALRSDIPANVLSHFDYVGRVQDIDTDVFLTIARPHMEKIFPEMIKRGIVLKLNTRSMSRYEQLSLYKIVMD